MTDSSDIPLRIAAALERIERLLRSGGQRAAQSLALSPLQLRVMGALKIGPGVRVGRLAEELLVTPGTVSEAVRVLEEKGLVSKDVDPEEHRAVIVRLTRKGRGVSKRADRWPEEVLGPVLDDLGLDGAGELLARLLGFLQALERRGLIETTRMCVNCEHFRPGAGRGRRPHYCALLESPIGSSELQVDCPDFDLADAEVLESRWGVLDGSG